MLLKMLVRLNESATRFEFSVQRRIECRYFVEQRTAIQVEKIVFREENRMMEFFDRWEFR